MKDEFLEFQNKTKNKVSRIIIDPRAIISVVEFEDDDGKPHCSALLLSGGALHLQDPARTVMDKIKNSRKDWITDEDEDHHDE